MAKLYNELDKHFTAPKRLSPFFDEHEKIPRKLKKRVKGACGVQYNGISNGKRLWYALNKTNHDYTRFLIKKICEANS